MLADAQAKATGTQRPLQDADIPFLVDSYAFRILKDAELSHFDPDDSAFNLPWVPSLRYSPIALNALDDAGQEIPGSRRERVLSGLPIALQVWKGALGSGDRAKVIEKQNQRYARSGSDLSYSALHLGQLGLIAVGAFSREPEGPDG